MNPDLAQHNSNLLQTEWKYKLNIATLNILTNGQIERVHSTIIEISRCIRDEFEIVNDLEVVIRAVQSYNQIIHSVTGKKPFEVLYNKVKHDDLINKLKDT